MANKYRQKPVKNTKKETANPLKTASKRLIQKTAEPTSDLVGHKNAEKVTNATSKSNREGSTKIFTTK